MDAQSLFAKIRPDLQPAPTLKDIERIASKLDGDIFEDSHVFWKGAHASQDIKGGQHCKIQWKHACGKWRPVGVHRLLYTLFVADPGHLWVCHKCDTDGRCVCLQHLYAGTPSDNSRDAVAMGNQGLPWPTKDQATNRVNGLRTPAVLTSVPPKECSKNWHSSQKQTADEVSEIVRLSNAGVSGVQIGKRFSCSKKAISDILDRERINGVKVKRKQLKSLSTFHIVEIMRMGSLGTSATQIALELGLSKATVSKRLKASGRCTGHKSCTRADKEKLLRLFAEGASRKDLAGVMGSQWSETRVYHFLYGKKLIGPNANSQ